MSTIQDIDAAQEAFLPSAQRSLEATRGVPVATVVLNRLLKQNKISADEYFFLRPAAEARGQATRHSLVETVISTAIGYLINIVAQLLVLPIFGIHISVRDDFLMGMIFTVISIVRGFGVRRLFNYLHVKGIL